MPTRCLKECYPKSRIFDNVINTTSLWLPCLMRTRGQCHRKSAVYELWPNRLEKNFVEKLWWCMYAQTNKSLIHITMIRNVRKAWEIIMMYNDDMQYYIHKTKHMDAWLKSLHRHTIIITARMIAQRHDLAIMFATFCVPNAHRDMTAKHRARTHSLSMKYHWHSENSVFIKSQLRQHILGVNRVFISLNVDQNLSSGVSM